MAKENKTKEEQKSTQSHLEIAEIKQGILTLKNGGMRAVILVRPINFGLKSEEEQNAIIYSYQAFLNSLEFPLQILIKSKKFDLNPYIEKMEKLAQGQRNELLRLQTAEYIDFIKRLSEVANIMTKEFYVVVPYNPPILETKGILQKLLGNKSKKPKINPNSETGKIQLSQRTEAVMSQLENMGMRCVQLNTKELIELFYNIYNPESSQIQKLTDTSNITSLVIEKQR